MFMPSLYCFAKEIHSRTFAKCWSSAYAGMLLCLLSVLQFFALTGYAVSADFLVPLRLALDRKILKSVEGNLLSAEVVEGFYVTVDLGTPSQRLNLFVDTGSSDLAVASYPNSNLSTYFKWKESTSYNSEQKTVSTHYVEGFYKGTVGTDILTLSAASVTLRTTVITMSYAKGIFPFGAQWHGILGLSYPSLTEHTTFMQALDLQRDAGHFTVAPCRTSLIPSSETCGKLDFGGPVPTNVFFTPVIQAKYYSISLVGMAVGSVVWPGPCEELNAEQTIVDTGTSDLKFPPAVYKWLIGALSEVGYNLTSDTSTAYCLEDGFTTSAFPNLYLHIPGTNHRVYFQSVLIHSVDHRCHRLGISPSETGAVIGFTVLRSLVTAFNTKDNCVGFGEVPFNGTPRITITAANYTRSGQNCLQRMPPPDGHIWRVFHYVLAFICAMCAIPTIVVAFLCIRRRIGIYRARNKTDAVSLVEF
ncbi:beta-secretase 2-like isoform X2 [Ornithodoros turicata]|uniref:beta-secretase 2-like isoform X2 n=1 Tax=Ornithodoros turicata TaxID=34597 RepID=UPI003138CA04